MSECAIFQAILHSPRYGTDHRYLIQVDGKEMKIEKSDSMSYAVCEVIEGQDLAWTGSQPDSTAGNPMINILEHDAIYPPSVFIRALERAWDAWRNNELDDTQLTTEIVDLFKWVNSSAAIAPRTEFWKRIF